MPLRLLFMGPPGVGKGTQAALLSERHGLKHLAAGDIFRAEMADGTELGNMAQQYIAQGRLVPDKVTIGMMESRMRAHHSAGHGFILDGFPRNEAQSTATDAILEDLGVELDAAIVFEAPEEVIIERMLGRGRRDDTIQIIRRRLKVFSDETKPILEHYDGKGKLTRIDANREPEDIYASIMEAVKP